MTYDPGTVQTLNTGLDALDAIGAEDAPGGSLPPDSPVIDPASENLTGIDELEKELAAEPEDPGTDPEGANNTGGLEADKAGTADDDKKDAAEKDAASTEDGKKGGKQRLDRDERFQQLRKERDEYKAKVEGKAGETAPKPIDLADLARVLAPRTDLSPEEMPPVNFKDMTKMSDEELREWQIEKPQEYAANQARQTYWEIKVEQLKDGKVNTLQTKIRSKLDSFQEKHPDFKTKLESGEIRDYLRDNPGDSVFSAYHELSVGSDAKTIDQRIAEAKAEGAKEAEEKLRRDLKAGRSVTPLASTGPGPETNLSRKDPRLQDTKKHGGLEAVMLQRLQERRKRPPA